MHPDYQSLYEEALNYDAAGDVYTAVKLLKKVTRLVPEWPEAFVSLGQIYHRRREWKPAFHYWTQAVALNADDREAWWHLGLAAVSLGRMRIATSVWDKFGFLAAGRLAPLALEVPRPTRGYEILWMQPLDAGRGRILSIPHPASQLHYQDLMIYDRRDQRGTSVVNQRRIPVYASLGRRKRSPYQTFSCLLHTNAEAAIQSLEKLCREARLGFEVWSNATRALRLDPAEVSPAQRDNFPEYYNDLMPRPDHGTTLVAMAAVHPAEIERVLNAWEIITLEGFSDLKHH